MGKAKRARPAEADDSPQQTFGSKKPMFGASADPPSGDGGRKSKLVAHIQALNTQFLTWVNTQSAMAAGELWTAGVQDYLDHAEGIREEFSDVISPGSKKADAAPAFGGFGSKPSADAPAFGSTNGAAAKEPPAEKAAVAPAFGAPKSGSPAGADASKEKPAFGGAFSFGAKPDTKKDGDGDAAARPSGGGLFSFGGASAGGDAGASKPTGGFSFGGASTGALPAFGSGSGGFQFGAAGGKAEEGAGDGGDGAEEDEEEEKEAKARRVRVDTEPEDDENENVFEAKAKYFMQDLKDKSWNEIGLGLVVVKRPKAGGKPFVIFRKTEGGRVLLTTPVYEGMRLTPGQNNPKMGVCNVYPLEVDHKTQERQVAKEPRTALFKVGKAETIEELNKVLAAK